MDIPDFIYKTFNFKIGSYAISFPYVQAIAIIFLLFLLIVSLAQFRRHYVDWSFKGAGFGILFGFLLAIIFEGFLVVYGNTFITAVLGWKNAPKPLSVALEAGRNKLSNVLGVKTETEIESKDVLKIFQSLSPSENKKIKSIICQ